MKNPPSFAIVADNISMKMGGEASLAFYYFKLFRSQGLEVWAVCHSRVRDELRAAFSEGGDFERFRFVEDSAFQKFIYRVGKFFPYRIEDLVFGQIVTWSARLRSRRVVKTLISEKKIKGVFEPSPISPTHLSFMYDLGVPVVIGPLCGGLEFPPAFAYLDSFFTRWVIKTARKLANFLHRLCPGMLQASVLLVANQRTERALPKKTAGRKIEVIESGVDLSIWKPRGPRKKPAGDPVRFVYSGRLVDWKGVGFLIEAFIGIAKNTHVTLDIIGEGDLRGALEARAAKEERIRFHGFVERPIAARILSECDVFVMPSLRECGGTAILEAMATGIPVIVTQWAGPAQYVTSESGILVDPSSPEDFTRGLKEAMTKLSQSEKLREEMGKAGIERVKQEFLDWNSKADRVSRILLETFSADLPGR
jgi:glycosyltransferase involved in cell wall biosynthesis